MIMCVLLCYPVSIRMSQLQSTGHPISSLLIKFANFYTTLESIINKVNKKEVILCGYFNTQIRKYYEDYLDIIGHYSNQKKSDKPFFSRAITQKQPLCISISVYAQVCVNLRQNQAIYAHNIYLGVRLTCKKKY